MRPSASLPVSVTMPAAAFSRWVSTYAAEDTNRTAPTWLSRVRVSLESLLSREDDLVLTASRANAQVGFSPEFEDSIARLKVQLGICLKPSNEGPLIAPDDSPPFPRCLGTELDSYWSLVNEHVAYRLAQMKVKKVLEVGAGFFSLTKVLVEHGFEVSVIEPNTHAKELMAKQGLMVALTNEPFSRDALSSSTFDCVIFMESFHHMPSPVQALEDAFSVAPNILLCAEPITSDASILPYPWGPRLDGESMYAMVCHGWNENGFSPEFVAHLAEHFGAYQEVWFMPGIHHSHIVALRRGGAV